MKNHLYSSLPALTIVILALLSTACASRRPEGSEAQPVAETPEAQGEAPKEIQVNIQLEDVIQWDQEEETQWEIPDSLIFTVEVENVDTEDAEALGVNFVYEALIPSGETTYMLADPQDPEGGYRRDENGRPILYKVMDTLSGKVESLEDVESTRRTFDITRPEGTCALRYWAEVYLLKSTGHEEKVFVDTPYVTGDDLQAQGGIISVAR